MYVCMHVCMYVFVVAMGSSVPSQPESAEKEQGQGWGQDQAAQPGEEEQLGHYQKADVCMRKMRLFAIHRELLGAEERNIQVVTY